MKRLIECVPNFSEGKNMQIIEAITSQAANINGMRLLDVDPGASTNRTVVTIVGEPDAIIEGAFLMIRKAAELIDMRKHSGAHPRMGATDVCPLIPISGISVEETIEYSRILAKRVAEELNIPVYLYEKSASASYRKNLADIRSGEYEGFFEKIKLKEWKPDYGPEIFPATTGATVIGVRDFLIAYNVNLNTTSVKRANSVAFDIRENGRIKTDNGMPWGKPVIGSDGEPERIPGICKGVKAIGWFVEEYGIAQVSMNITDMNTTPLHIAFEECLKSAQERGMRITGSEIVGLLPKQCLLDAGKYYLKMQERSEGVSESALIHIAIKSLGLSELYPFDPKKKIIEYMVGEEGSELVSMSLNTFTEELASESPAPGGGSVAALCGALGISLGTMVANLSAGKRGWEEKMENFSTWALKGQELRTKLLALVDEDTQAFNKVMDAFGLPKSTEDEKQLRIRSIEAASKGAAMVPYKVMTTAFQGYALIAEMASAGNPSSVTDAGVGALCLHTSIQGAALNVRINLKSIKDAEFKSSLAEKVNELTWKSEENLEKIMEMVEGKMK